MFQMSADQAILVSQLQVGGTVLAVLAVALLARKWILNRLDQAARKDPKSIAGLLRDDLGTPTLLWCLVVALDILLNSIALSARVQAVGHALVVSFLILSFTMVFSSFLMRAMQRYGERQKLPFVVAGLSRTLTRILVFSLGLLILLAYLGISITPVLTALGVGGLAVALALQDTLANLFAGIHILVEQPIAVGDFIRLSADEEGTVSDIGWRTTRLVTGANSMVVIPNKTITSNNLVNYSMPSPEVGVWVPVMLGLEADMAKAERLALAAAAGTDGVLADSGPVLIADPGMQPTHLQYRLIFRVARQTESGMVRTRVIRRMLEAFRKEGIPMPEVRGR